MLEKPITIIDIYLLFSDCPGLTLFRKTVGSDSYLPEDEYSRKLYHSEVVLRIVKNKKEFSKTLVLFT